MTAPCVPAKTSNKSNVTTETEARAKARNEQANAAASDSKATAKAKQTNPPEKANPWIGRVGGGNHPEHPELRRLLARADVTGQAGQQLEAQINAQASQQHKMHANAQTADTKAAHCNRHSPALALPEAKPVNTKVRLNSADAAGNADNVATCVPTSKVKAQALVSRVEGAGMLICEVLLGGQLATAHLDSCATHCFVSSSMSRQLTARGYPPIASDTMFEVSQGQPLCDSDLVHLLPLSMAREDGIISTWDQCLFIVADAGAPIIICNTVLRLGGIVKYDPPTGYADALSRLATTEHRKLATPGGRATPPGNNSPLSIYVAPSRTSGRCLRTALLALPLIPPEETTDSKILPPTESSDDSTRHHHHSSEREKIPVSDSPGKQEQVEPDPLTDLAASNPATALATSAADGAKVTKKRKGETSMLSEEDPFGKNPPLPEEVMEAVRHLKLLSSPSTTPNYSSQQIEDIRSRLSQLRPAWARCLTLQKTLDVADKETEQFLYDLMDKPKYKTSIFSSCMKKCCDLGEYEIKSKPGVDFWTPPQPRRFKNPDTTQIVDAWLDALLDNGKCRESNASHPACVTVVMKDGRDPRVCIDYRNRNARSDVPVFPMPDVHDFLDENEGFKYYCSFDMAKMFTQFRLKEEHKHLAAFITHRGVFEPNVVMFGLQGGPQHAVRECGGAMAKDPLTNGKDFTKWALVQNANGVQPPYQICPSLGVVKGSRLRPFIDDVTVPSNHLEGMKKLVELFLEFCFKHNLILSRKKAKIMKTHLRMLGFVVSEDGKHLDPQRIITLLEAKKPQSKETLHALLSSYTFVRMFIPNFASIAAPLHEATRGIIWKGPLSGKSKGIREVDPDFVWTPEMIRAYEQLRNALLEAPILVKVDWRFPLFLSVDASLRGEGWVLWQLITTSDGTKVAVAILYGSRKYSDTERNWEVTRQEVSALRDALVDVEDYVFGQHFYVFSDHLNLRFMHHSINRAVLRLRDFLSQFNMTVIHCPGIWNNADSISRLENEQLPVDLAQNLNSATEARLEGTITKYSLGTSTEEDPHLPGNSELQPRIRVAQETSGGTSQATVLRTQATSSCRAAATHSLCKASCLLCNIKDVKESAEPDLPRSVCLHTVVEETLPLSDAQFGEWETLIGSLFRHSELPMAVLRDEANNWNKRTIQEAKSRVLRFFDEPNHEDSDHEKDVEDLNWCGDIHRSAYVLRTAAGQHFHPRRLSPRLAVLKEPKESRKKVRFNLEPPVVPIEEAEATGDSGMDVVTEPDLPFEPAANKETSSPIVVIDTNTQTCPADFRVATIRFPMIDDFKAIHGHESGHHGIDYSYRKLMKKCGSKWANERGEATKVKAALKEFIDACPICQKVRGLKEKVKAKHSFIVSRPFLEVSYDFIILKEDKNGNRNLLVAIDNFLKIVEIRASPHRDAETVVKFLLELASRYGHMARLRSDKDGAFINHLIEKLNKARGTEAVPCVPYHPQANSICERQNGLIMNHLNAMVLECKLGPESDIAWSDLIPEVFALVNSTPKNPLGISPISMMYGVFANYDYPLLPTPQANVPGTVSNPADYVDSLMAWQNQLLEVTERVQSEHFEKLEHKFNKTATNRVFNVGDFVLQHKQGTGTSGKPNARWLGPFLVVERRNNDPSHPVVDLMNLTDMKVKEASIEDCRQFNSSWFDEENLLPELTKLAATDRNEYVVERIVSHKPTGEKRTLPLSKYLFEVKWQDFDETTWEPYSELRNLEPMDAYAAKHPGLKLDK